VAELSVALPSTRAAVNSRGDAHAMVRGAPERHVQAYLDGIPLNIPWDERVDLETVPAMAVGAMEGRRGPTSLLDGPGVLAGSLRLLPPSAAGPEAITDMRAAAGTDGLGRVELAHRRRAGAWNLMGAGAWRTRDAWPLPEGGGERENSDLRQTALLLRAARPVAGTGRLSLVGTGWTGEKGAPRSRKPKEIQLALFAAPPHPVVEELKKLDPDTLTPTDALNLLKDLSNVFFLIICYDYNGYFRHIYRYFLIAPFEVAST